MTEHPTILQQLLNGNIRVLDEEAVSSISPEAKVSMIEILLNISSTCPLSILYSAPLYPKPASEQDSEFFEYASCCGNDTIIRHLFGVSRVLIEPHEHSTAQSALDNENLRILNSFLSRRTRLSFAQTQDYQERRVAQAFKFKSDIKLMTQLLNIAVRLDHVALLNLLDKHDIYVDSPMALRLAVLAGASSVVEFLVEIGIDVNKPNSVNMTPLGLIVNAEPDALFSLNVTRMLVKHGADLFAHVAPSCSRSILKDACLKKKRELFSFFLENCFVNPTMFKDVPAHRAFLRCIADGAFEKSPDFRDMFARHLVKIAALFCSSEFDEDLSSLWSKDPIGLAVFRSECESELLQLKTAKIHNTDVPLLDLLRSPDRRVSRLLSNKSVTRGIESLNLIHEFPYYGNILKERVEKCKSFNLCLKEACKSLDYFLSPRSIDLPAEIKELIFGYLRFVDLVRLKRAAHARNARSRSRPGV